MLLFFQCIKCEERMSCRVCGASKHPSLPHRARIAARRAPAAVELPALPCAPRVVMVAVVEP